MQNIPLEYYYKAFYAYQKRNGSCVEASEYGMNYREHLLALYDSVLNRRLDLGTSTAFLVYEPVMREVFAGSMDKRIVDTLVIMLTLERLEEVLPERMYNCRKGKGAYQCISQLQEDIRRAEKENCYLYHGDIHHFFMSINKNILLVKWLKVIKGLPYEEDLEYIIRTLIEYRAQEHCVVVGKKEEWAKIPKEKSLFGRTDTGLPIGDLFSQFSALVYLADFEKEMNEMFPFGSGIYMDDFYIVGDKQRLLAARPVLNAMLQELGLSLNEKKEYFQPYYHGIRFLGFTVRENRIYASNRVVSHAWQAVLEFSETRNAERFCQRMNSLFGIMRHCNSYTIRRNIAHAMPGELWQLFYMKGHYEIFNLKTKNSYDYRNLEGRGKVA